MVKINGEFLEVAGETIEEYLEKSYFDMKCIAVECNEEFIPKTRYAEILLKDGDILEVVSFVGGG